MASYSREEIELVRKHEEILCRRASAVQRMEEQKSRQNQGDAPRAVKDRNSRLLETRYWATVKKKLPEWEKYFLGKDQPPVCDAEISHNQHRLNSTNLQDSSPAHVRGKPPRPKPRSAGPASSASNSK